jgi:nucleoside-diphosphate-sugar epimerase
MKKTVIVTGANGFLGINLVKALADDYNVVAISRSNDKIQDFNFEFISMTMDKYDCLKEIIQEKNPDFLIHFAWDGGNSYKDINSLEQYNNVINSTFLLEAIKDTNTHFIGLGAGAEYGPYQKSVSEINEEIPISNYGRAKFLFKQVSYNFCKQNDIKWTWIRPFYTYGPYDVETRLIPKVINSCMNNQELQLDDCSSYSDYIFIDDFINIFKHIIDDNLEGIYNICSGKSQNIKQLVEEILVHYKNNLVSFDKPNDRKNFCHNVSGDNSKIQNFSNFKLTPLHQGIMKTIKFYEERNQL